MNRIGLILEGLSKDTNYKKKVDKLIKSFSGKYNRKAGSIYKSIEKLFELSEDYTSFAYICDELLDMRFTGFYIEDDGFLSIKNSDDNISILDDGFYFGDLDIDVEDDYEYNNFVDFMKELENDFKKFEREFKSWHDNLNPSDYEDDDDD